MSVRHGVYSDVPTSAIPFEETEHGRLRRKQRGIDKKDLQAAMKHGKRYDHKWQGGRSSTQSYCSRYEYKDISYIVNNKTGKEVTSYAKPVKLDTVKITSARLLEHEAACRMIRQDTDCWTSNTVIVVDTSGSMRASDVWGARTRLGAVWISVALDFVAHRLEIGEAKPTDVVSVITLSETPTLLVKEAPFNWLLYNKIVTIYNRRLVVPSSHGPFIPSLAKAEELLTSNQNSSCAATLIFLSDGAPSDEGSDREELIKAQVGTIASKFGRRLTFTAIGIGDKENFCTLQSMVDEAKDYGAKAELELPSLSSEAIGVTFTSSVTSTIDTQREMTDIDTLKQKQVRSVQRESRRKASENLTTVSPDDFWIYPAYRVTRRVYKEWLEGRTRNRSFEDAPLQHPDAKYVALSKGPFGEGAERFAYRFFELAADGRTIVGKPLVAKESRFILESADHGLNEEERKKFVKTFCSTQQLARQLAEQFNAKLDRFKCIHCNTPRIRFLDCSIYVLNDRNTGVSSVLVEDKLDHEKWKKWNSNNGYVEGVPDSLPSRCDLRVNANDLAPRADLDILEEGSEEDEDSDEGEDVAVKIQPKLFFLPGEVAQAFSHFTYRATWRKRLVCDLQGVFDVKSNLLMLSDPVIHYYNQHDQYRTRVHGRTDRGRKGIEDFFHTHKQVHGHLCCLMLRGFKNFRGQNG